MQIYRIRYESVSSNDEIPSSITVEDLEIEVSNAIPSQFYFFYQGKALLDTLLLNLLPLSTRLVVLLLQLSMVSKYIYIL
jgi:hypothetical protein